MPNANPASAQLTRSPRLKRAALVGALAAVAVTGLAACSSAAKGASAPATSASVASSSAASSSVASSSAAPQATSAAAGEHLITNNGHKLAFYVTPGHLPAIVLDAGGGLDASSWSKVAPVLAEKTGSEVITYDRSGEGKSDEVPGAWTAANAVSDLHAGLTDLGVTDHIVLVSHSLAGEIATGFVNSYAGEVDGAVLVDASLPTFYTDTEVARLVAGGAPSVAAAKKAPSTKETRQLLAEAVNYGPVHNAYHQRTWPQSVPATAIVSASTPYDSPVDANQWRAAQAEFVRDAPNRTLVTAAKSSHDIEIDRPDVIISSVEAMVTQVD